jgi:hypothetical protein
MDTFGIMAVNCIAQACCWYNIFTCCGCMEPDRRRVYVEEQQSPVITVSTSYPQNPFISSVGLPKDIHLEPAYDYK